MASPVTVLRDSDIDRMSANAPVLRDSDIEAHEQQPSAFARFLSPFIEPVIQAVQMIKHPADALKVAGHLAALASQAAVNPQAAGTEMGRQFLEPMAQDIADKNYAGAAGHATLNALMLAAPEAGEIAEGVGTAGRAVGAGVRAAAPDVVMGAAQIGAGELLGQIPRNGVAHTYRAGLPRRAPDRHRPEGGIPRRARSHARGGRDRTR